jgi:FAD/FMN-containing dehydrogenase
VSELRENVLQVEGNRASVGAGVRLADVYPALAPYGKIFPGGECSVVAVSGLTLGGGVSLLSRSLGLTIDTLQEMTVVTAQGEVLRVSEDRHPDLFWALRGGGGSFAVATSLDFELSPLRDEVLAGWASWSPKNGPAALRDVVAYIESEAPRELNLECYFHPAKTRILIMFSGDAEEGRRVVGGLLDRTRAEARHLALMPYGQYVSSSFVKPKGRFYAYWRAAFIDHAPSLETMELLRDGAALATSEHDFVSFEFFNGAVHDRPSDATAFVHRNRLAILGVFGNWVGSPGNGNQCAWAEALFQQVAPRLSRSAYVNYPSRALEDSAEAYFGENYPRLQQVKAKYDPDDVFNFPQSVRLPSPDGIE